MVEFRAFRGTRRSSVYRAHSLSDGALARIVAVAATGNLAELAALGRPGSHELDRRGARRLAEEVNAIRARATLLDLDGELTAIAEVASWCARSRERSWLRVARPPG